MTQPAFDENSGDLDFPQLTLDDYIEIVGDDLDEAVHNLEEREIEALCRVIRKKIGTILGQFRRREPDEPTPEPERDPNDRWWDR